MSDTSNLIDLASEIVEDNNIISPLVPSPNIKLSIDKNNPFDIVADEVDIKNANADDPFEMCSDDALKTENIREDIFQNNISQIKNISFDNIISPIKKENENMFESSRIQSNLVDIDNKFNENIQENNTSRNNLKNSPNKANDSLLLDSFKFHSNLLEFDNLQASLLNLHEMDSLKINDNLFSQDEASLLNKLEINDNSQIISNENSLADKIDFLNTSVDDLKALVARRIDKCIKSGLNESKTNFNCSVIEPKKEFTTPPKTLNRAYSESSCLNKLNMSQAESNKAQNISDITQHFKSKKALSDLTRDLISLKNFRRSSVSAPISNSFTQTKEFNNTNNILDDPIGYGKKISDEEEPELLLTNSFEIRQSENTNERINKTPKNNESENKVCEQENKFELKTKFGENDIVIIVTPSCKSNSKNFQESLVPHVTETLNTLFGKNEDNMTVTVHRNTIPTSNKEENKISETPVALTSGKPPNPLIRLKKNIVNSLNKGPLKATMPIQHMAKESIKPEDKSLGSNIQKTPNSKKETNLKPKATSTPLNSTSSRRLNSQLLTKKSFQPAKGSKSSSLNRSFTDPPVSPSVPLLKRSNSMTSPKKVTDLYRLKKTTISNATKQNSPTMKKSSKSATSPLHPKQNLIKTESSSTTSRKILGKPILKLRKNVLKLEKENKCK